MGLIDGALRDGARVRVADGVILLTGAGGLRDDAAVRDLERAGRPIIEFADGGSLETLLDDLMRLIPEPCVVDAASVGFDVFAVENGVWGTLAWVRVRRGPVANGMAVVNVRTGARAVVGLIARAYRDRLEVLGAAGEGELCALRGFPGVIGDGFAIDTR